MTLSPDFGHDYIEKGGTTFPENRAGREQIVEYFRIAHDALTRLGYEPDISGLVGAYHSLSDSLREKMDNGEIVSGLNPYELHLVRKYIVNSSSFFGEADMFAISQLAAGQIDENTVVTVRNTYEASTSIGVPPYMVVAYAESLASAN